MFGTLKRETVFRKWAKQRAYIPELGERHTVLNWVREDDGPPTMVEMHKYGELLKLLPDKIVENLEKARLSRDGTVPLIKAGLGYEEALSAVILDGTAVGTSSAEARLFPALLIGRNYMAPSGLPGRTLRFQLRGRGTTLITTAGTMTLRNRIAATDVITGTTLQATGAVTADAAAQTNSQWEWEGHATVRTVGTGGTIFCQGDADFAWAATTIANQHAKFSGSAGQDAPAAAAYDTTIDQYFEMTAQWSLATAYSIQGHLYFLEALN